MIDQYLDQLQEGKEGKKGGVAWWLFNKSFIFLLKRSLNSTERMIKQVEKEIANNREGLKELKKNTLTSIKECVESGRPEKTCKRSHERSIKIMDDLLKDDLRLLKDLNVKRKETIKLIDELKQL